jgi:hypothetical protein
MTDELKRRLDALRKVAPKLRAVADDANKIVKDVEKVLVEEMGIGVSATANAFLIKRQRETDDNERVREEEVSSYLAFGRVDGSYCIHVLIEHQERGDNGWFTETVESKRVRWSQCDRETRLRAFETLPKLLDVILHFAEELAKKADATAAKIREMTTDNGVEDEPDQFRMPAAIKEAHARVDSTPSFVLPRMSEESFERRATLDESLRISSEAHNRPEEQRRQQDAKDLVPWKTVKSSEIQAERERQNAIIAEARNNAKPRTDAENTASPRKPNPRRRNP